MAGKHATNNITPEDHEMKRRAARDRKQAAAHAKRAGNTQKPKPGPTDLQRAIEKIRGYLNHYVNTHELFNPKPGQQPTEMQRLAKAIGLIYASWLLGQHKMVDGRVVKEAQITDAPFTALVMGLKDGTYKSLIKAGFPAGTTLTPEMDNTITAVIAKLQEAFIRSCAHHKLPEDSLPVQHCWWWWGEAEVALGFSNFNQLDGPTKWEEDNGFYEGPEADARNQVIDYADTWARLTPNGYFHQKEAEQVVIALFEEGTRPPLDSQITSLHELYRNMTTLFVTLCDKHNLSLPAVTTDWYAQVLAELKGKAAPAVQPTAAPKVKPAAAKQVKVETKTDTELGRSIREELVAQYPEITDWINTMLDTGDPKLPTNPQIAELCKQLINDLVVLCVKHSAPRNTFGATSKSWFKHRLPRQSAPKAKTAPSSTAQPIDTTTVLDPDREAVRREVQKHIGARNWDATTTAQVRAAANQVIDTGSTTFDRQFTPTARDYIDNSLLKMIVNVARNEQASHLFEQYPWFTVLQGGGYSGPRFGKSKKPQRKQAALTENFSRV